MLACARHESVSRIDGMVLKPDISACQCPAPIGSSENESDTLFTVIGDMGALLRGEQGDTSAIQPSVSKSTLQGIHSKLLRAATRYERERTAHEDRFNEMMQRMRDEICLNLDVAEHEAVLLDARSQRLLALQVRIDVCETAD